MEDSPRVYISEFGYNEDLDEMDMNEEETSMESDMVNSPYQDTERDSFQCQHCERHFSTKPGLERHMHIHTSANKDAYKYKSNILEQHEKEKPLDLAGSAMQLHTSSTTGSNPPVLLAGDHTAQPDKWGAAEGRHACKYCEKMFTTHINKRRHERRIHEQQHLEKHVEKAQLPQEENLVGMCSETNQQETELGDETAPAAVLEKQVGHTEQYMLDISSNISENLSFYIDGKIVSTSTVSSCEAAEVHSASATLVGLDALILDPTQISQVLNTDSEMSGQPLARRRTATPPLLPQIKTELESDMGVSASSSSLVCSLIENLFPQNTEGTGVQKERTVFLSPKLKQLLEKQDGLTPTLALIADSQKPSSPVALSVLPAGTGRFKRRTGSPPPSSPHHSLPEETAESGDCEAVSTGQVETTHSSPVKDDTPPPLDETVSSTESWPPPTGGNSCNQQPLDLSNTVKSGEDVASVDAALDLSFQKTNLGELTLNVVSHAVLTEGKSNESMVGMTLMDTVEQNISLMNPETSLLTDFTILTGPDMMTPMQSMAEGLLYGLALPSNSLTPSPSLTPLSLQPASPCTIAFASHASHTGLTTSPSLITVLAPSHISNPSNQPIQVLAPDISRESLVICTENALNFSECDLTTAFATTNSANPVTLSQPLDPTLNLPGHMFLSDQITLSPPLLESAPMSEGQFTPAVTLSDSLINSYSITSNTVLIECTIALEAPGGAVPAAVTLQENTAEPPAQMAVDHLEQEQIASVPNPPSEDPAILLSSITESVTLSTSSSEAPPPVGEPGPDPELVVNAEPPTVKEEEEAAVSAPELPSQTSPSSAEEEDASTTPSDAHQQTFTKNFICNVCDKLFHSMKELGHHVGHHADDWPYKCEFCVLLFSKPSALLDHRSSLHGVGKTYVCSVCTKEFVYLCNLKQHQEELHPGQQCTYTEDEKGKLRPQNYNNLTKANTESSAPDAAEETKSVVKKEEGEVDEAAEELFTTIKILASDGAKLKGPDVRLGINQHYPSYKPPPFPYHNRSTTGSLASATNFTTHNIPQTFSTAIRCTKCGKSFDNMPELHKHILTCANASDKRRYTPKRNPIPLRHFAKTQNGVLSTTNSTNGLNASNRPSQSNRSKPNQEPAVRVKFKVLSKRKKKMVQRVMPQRNKSIASSNKMSRAHVDEQQEIFVCPHCSREFTMRRSRTKHMAVCPKKPKEVKKRKEGGISVTKENDGHLRRGAEETKQSSPLHKTRLQTSGPAKRPAILPVQTVLSNKRSKIIIKEPPNQETPTLSELPTVRTFNPSMRQYSRMQHSAKGIPIKITIVKPQQAAPPSPAGPEDSSSSEQSPAV